MITVKRGGALFLLTNEPIQPNDKFVFYHETLNTVLSPAEIIYGEIPFSNVAPKKLMHGCELDDNYSWFVLTMPDQDEDYIPSDDESGLRR